MFTNRFLIIASAMMISSVALAQNLHYEGNSVTVVEPGANVTTTPIIADEKICGDRFTETVVLDRFPAVRRNLKYVDGFQAIALAELARKHDADFIIVTQINVCTSDGCFAVTVTGYPARYENFRQPTADDLKMLRNARINGYGHFIGDAYTSESRSYYAGLIDSPRVKIDPGFQQMMDLAFVPTDDLAFELTYTAGYRFTNCFFLGAGTGIAYSDWNGAAYIPVYVTPMFYLTTKRVAPILALRLGVNASLVSNPARVPVTPLVDLRPGIRVHTNSGKDINVTLTLGTRPDIYQDSEEGLQFDTYFKGGLCVGFSF